MKYCKDCEHFRIGIKVLYGNYTAPYFCNYYDWGIFNIDIPAKLSIHKTECPLWQKRPPSTLRRCWDALVTVIKWNKWRGN